MEGTDTREAPRRHIREALDGVPSLAMATVAGEHVRCSLVPFACRDDLSICVALPRSDLRLMQLSFNPAVSLLAVDDARGRRREVEVNGQARILKTDEEARQARDAIARRAGRDAAPTGEQAYLLVIPQRIVLRSAGAVAEIFDFPENRTAVAIPRLLGRKLLACLISVRAPFLTATLAPISLGGAVAWATRDSLNWGLFALALVAGALLHMAANVFNDYFDHLSGNDPINVEFIRPFSGGSRAIQLGLLSPLETLTEAVLLSGVSAGIGAYLAWASGPWVLAFGAAGLASSVFYVGGPFKWAARGVGELLVGLNFGTLMTLGSYYVQTERVDWTPAIASIPVAILIAAVLYVNEFPDYSADAAVGKRTWVVRLGRKRASFVYAFLMVAPYLGVVAAVAAAVLPLPALLALLTAPLALRALYIGLRFHSQPLELAPANALTIVVHLSTGLLLTLGYVWDGSGVGQAGYVAGFALLFVLMVAFVSRGIEQEKRAFLAAREAT